MSRPGDTTAGSGRDQEPTPPEGLLVVIAELALGELLQVVRQRASATAESVARAGVGKAPQIGVHLASNLDTDLMLMPAAADDLRPYAVLHHRRHGGHFPLVP